jgi:hypothetical protein
VLLSVSSNTKLSERFVWLLVVPEVSVAPITIRPPVWPVIELDDSVVPVPVLFTSLPSFVFKFEYSLTLIAIAPAEAEVANRVNVPLPVIGTLFTSSDQLFNLYIASLITVPIDAVPELFVIE